MKSTIYVACLSLFLLSGCSSIYMPNVPAAPMLTQSGEFYGGGHVSLKGNFSGNAALAVTDHIGLMANASYIDQNKSRKDFNQTLVEGGIGYFDTFGPGNKRIFEIYGGYGLGSTERTYKDLTYDGPVVTDLQEVNFDKTFLQLNYSAKKNKDLTLFGKKYPLNYGTILRVSYVNMTDFKRNGIAQLKKEYNVFIEPVFFTRMYIGKNMQLQYTSGSNIGLIDRDFLTAGNSVFSLGLVFNLL